jgi:hypothetical protein
VKESDEERRTETKGISKTKDLIIPENILSWK